MPEIGSTEQSMEETLKKLERQLADESGPGNQPLSAEILKLPETGSDTRKSRAQNRMKASLGTQHVSAAADALGSGREVSATSDTSMLQSAASVALAAGDEHALSDHSQFPDGVSATLEELVRELVKPMLKRHLDAKLGDIIHRLVQAELTKALEEISAS